MDPKVVIIVGTIALLLQIGALASPGWIRVKIDEGGTLDMGLWFLCVGGTCVSYDSILDAIDDTDSIDGGFNRYSISDAWLEFQIETILGVAACLVGVILACMRKSPNARNLLSISATAFVISGVLAWIPAGKFAQLHIAIAALDYFDVPYSIIILAIGATLALLNFILALVARSSIQTPAMAGHVMSPGYQMTHVTTQGHPPQAGQQYGYPPNAGYPGYVNPQQGYVNPQQGQGQGYNYGYSEPPQMKY